MDAPANRTKVAYWASLGKPIVPIVVERRSLHMEEGTYQYGGTHFYLASQTLTRHITNMQEGSDQALNEYARVGNDQALARHLLNSDYAPTGLNSDPV